MADWDREAKLGTLACVGVQLEGGSFSQDVFGYVASLLHVGRKAAGEGKDFFIQEGDADFQGVGHAHAVGFLEDVAWEPVAQVDFLHAVGIAHSQGSVVVFFQEALGASGAGVFAKEGSALLQGKDVGVSDEALFQGFASSDEEVFAF